MNAVNALVRCLQQHYVSNELATRESHTIEGEHDGPAPPTYHRHVFGVFGDQSPWHVRLVFWTTHVLNRVRFTVTFAEDTLFPRSPSSSEWQPRPPCYRPRAGGCGPQHRLPQAGLEHPAHDSPCKRMTSPSKPLSLTKYAQLVAALPGSHSSGIGEGWCLPNGLLLACRNPTWRKPLPLADFIGDAARHSLGRHYPSPIPYKWLTRSVGTIGTDLVMTIASPCRTHSH